MIHCMKTLFIGVLFLFFSNAEAQDIDIVTYELVGNNLGEQENHSVDEEFLYLQEDVDLHLRIWEEFKALIPSSYWDTFVRLQLTTDDLDGTLAAVDKTTFDSSSNEWVLLVDIVDAEDAFATGSPELKNTLIHELGHVLTLSTDQVDWDNPGISLDNESTEEDVSDFFLLQEDCVSGVLVQEGCLNEDSYFNQFFQAFWSQDVFDEHLNFILENTPEEAAEKLYQASPDNYVSEYAATNPGEDIAESWMYFVILDASTGNSIKDDKINFFYQFDELVELRQDIRFNSGDKPTIIASSSWGQIKMHVSRK